MLNQNVMIKFQKHKTCIENIEQPKFWKKTLVDVGKGVGGKTTILLYSVPDAVHLK